MNRIIFTCNHLETRESLSVFVVSKFNRLLQRYDDIIRIRVELTLNSGKGSRKRFSARAISEQRGPDAIGAGESDNAYAALNRAFEKVERQTRNRARLARKGRERLLLQMRRTARIPVAP